MSIKAACDELVRQVKSANMKQLERVSGLAHVTLQKIRRKGEIGNVMTAVTLERTMEILAADPTRGRLKTRRARPKRTLPDGRVGEDVAIANGISVAAYRTRISRGWDLADAVTRPMEAARRGL